MLNFDKFVCKIFRNIFQKFFIYIYVIVMGIIKCEKVFAGIFTFSSLFEIKMIDFRYSTKYLIKNNLNFTVFKF